MTPSNWLGIVAFFFFIAPGLHYDRRVVRKRVRPRETAFAEISRVALVSTLCTGAAFALLGGFAAVCAWQDWNLLPDPAVWLRQGNSYFADNIWKVAATFLALSISALAIAELSYHCIYHADSGNINFDSSWRKALKLDRPAEHITMARVSMKDGSTWTGRVEHFSADLEMADRELILAPPVYRTPKPELNGTYRPTIDYPPEYEYVILKDAEIAFIAVKYVREPNANPGGATGSVPAPQPAGAVPPTTNSGP